jgi:hypothetical protein
MDDTIKEMPFSSLLNYQLEEEFETAKIKFGELLHTHNFSNYMYDSMPNQIVSNIDCAYYDIEGLNSVLSKNNGNFSVLHINLQSSFDKYALLKAYLFTVSSDFDVIAISEA